MTQILLVAHAPLASALACAAQHILGENTHCQALDLAVDESPAAFRQRIARAARPEISDQGLLVLADLAGGAPWNAALALGAAGALGPRWSVVGGVNLGMLLEALLASETGDSLEHLTQVALEVGRGQVRGHALDNGRHVRAD